MKSSFITVCAAGWKRRNGDENVRQRFVRTGRVLFFLRAEGAEVRLCGYSSPSDAMRMQFCSWDGSRVSSA